MLIPPKTTNSCSMRQASVVQSTWSSVIHRDSLFWVVAHQQCTFAGRACAEGPYPGLWARTRYHSAAVSEAICRADPALYDCRCASLCRRTLVRSQPAIVWASGPHMQLEHAPVCCIAKSSMSRCWQVHQTVLGQMHLMQ